MRNPAWRRVRCVGHCCVCLWARCRACVPYLSHDVVYETMLRLRGFTLIKYGAPHEHGHGAAETRDSGRLGAVLRSSGLSPDENPNPHAASVLYL